MADDPADLSSRDRILLAAMEVAAERGYQGTTISRVCKRAGLPASSLYWFFKDKDQLLAAAVQYSYERWRSGQAAFDPVPPGLPWAEALRKRLHANLGGLANAPHFLRIGFLLLLENRETSPTGRDMFQHIRRHTLGLHTGWFTGTLDPELMAHRPGLPEDLARLLLAFSDGLFISHEVDSPAWDPGLFADLLVMVVEGAAV